MGVFLPGGMTSPPLHGHLISTLATAPIRALSILAMLLLWKEPSKVTSHLMNPRPTSLVSSQLLHVALTVWPLVDKFLADEVATVSASVKTAKRVVRRK